MTRAEGFRAKLMASLHEPKKRAGVTDGVDRSALHRYSVPSLSLRAGAESASHCRSSMAQLPCTWHTKCRNHTGFPSRVGDERRVPVRPRPVQSRLPLEAHEAGEDLWQLRICDGTSRNGANSFRDTSFARVPWLASTRWSMFVAARLGQLSYEAPGSPS